MARGHRNTTPRSKGPGCSASANTIDHSITTALTLTGPHTVLAGKQKIQLPRANRQAQVFPSRHRSRTAFRHLLSDGVLTHAGIPRFLQTVRRLSGGFPTFLTASRRFRRLPNVFPTFPTASRRFRRLPDISDGFPTFRFRRLPDVSDGFPTLGPRGPSVCLVLRAQALASRRVSDATT